jgi:hypothetical protein
MSQKKDFPQNGDTLDEYTDFWREQYQDLWERSLKREEIFAAIAQDRDAYFRENWTLKSDLADRDTQIQELKHKLAKYKELILRVQQLNDSDEAFHIIGEFLDSEN